MEIMYVSSIQLFLLKNYMGGFITKITVTFRKNKINNVLFHILFHFSFRQCNFHFPIIHQGNSIELDKHSRQQVHNQSSPEKLNKQFQVIMIFFLYTTYQLLELNAIKCVLSKRAICILLCDDFKLQVYIYNVTFKMY